ncbi:MAG: alpha/beta hydrolase [Pseudohongiellaceae bacterium]|nr:alpha/beta hydrolase [Pseudohongiellaceae bacterium]
MFDSLAAHELRQTLPPVDLKAFPSRSPLFEQYRQHYGLDFPDNAKLGHLQHSIGYFDSEQYTVSCQQFVLDESACAGTIFLVHGYYDHIGLYEHLIEYWLLRGFRLIAFDLPGHGLSSGGPAVIESFASYCAALGKLIALAHQAQLPKPWHIMGQSTGCSIIMDYCLEDCGRSEELFDEVVLLAPLVKPYQWWRGSLLHSVLEPFVDGVPRNFVDNSGDLEFLEFVRDGDPLQSRRLSAKWVRALKTWLQRFDALPNCTRALTIIQGTDDKTVDWRYNIAAIQRKFSHVQVHRIAQARHHLVNERPAIRSQIFDILNETISG